MNGKAFTISQYKLFVGAFSNYGDQNTKNSVSRTDGEVQTSLEGEEKQSSKINPKLRIQWLWC